MEGDMSEQWGPWIEHDGCGCPVPNGTVVHVVYESGQEIIASVSANGRPDCLNPWVWVLGYQNIIRYRIRKPRGMIILESILRGVEDCPSCVS